MLVLGSLLVYPITHLLGLRENSTSIGAVLASNLYSQTSQTFTLQIYIFPPLCPVETVLMMAFVFYLTNPVCGLLAVGSQTLHSSGDFPFESDHNSEVWSYAVRGIFFNEMMNISNNRDLCEPSRLRGLVQCVKSTRLIVHPALKMRGICHCRAQ